LVFGFNWLVPFFLLLRFDICFQLVAVLKDFMNRISEKSLQGPTQVLSCASPASWLLSFRFYRSSFIVVFRFSHQLHQHRLF
jgi:hypothetical protein